MTKIITIIVENLVTLKAAAKQELLFNKPASEAGVSYKSSFLTPALGATKFANVRDMILVTLSCAAQVRLKCLTNSYMRMGLLLALRGPFGCDPRWAC